MTIQLNPTTSDTYETKTLAQLRAMVFNKLGFVGNADGQPGTTNATATLADVRGDIYNMLGFAAMPIAPPGVNNLLTSFINEAQQTAYRRLELNTLASGAPPLLVNATDPLTVDPVVVRMLALGISKAHYGKEDGAIYLKQADKYFADQMARMPPNAFTTVNRIISDAQIMLYRAYKLFRMERWFTWTFVANQRFYSITGNDERAPLSPPTGVAVTAGVAGTYGSMTDARYLHTATLMSSGGILVTGGNAVVGDLNSAEIYNTSTGLFATTGAMVSRRNAHTASLLPDGRVLITGGENADYLSTCEVYSPSGSQFSPVGSLSFARSLHAAVTLADGRVLVVGGGTNSLVVQAEIFNPATGSFTTTDSLAHGRYNPAVVLLPAGKVLVAGGEGASGVRNDAELYDPAAGTFSAAVGTLAVARTSSAAVVLSSGKVLICGGFNGSFTSQAACDIYDPGANSFSTTGALSTARGFHTATLLPNGKVLVTGGLGNSGALSSAELYNPIAGTWSTVGTTLAAAREQQCAVYSPFTLKTYIIGGETGTVALASMDVYDYAANALTTSGINISGVYSYRVAFVDVYGHTTLASIEATSGTIPGNTSIVVTWTAPTNAAIKYAVIYGRAAGVEQRLGQVDASVNTYIDYGTLTPSGALPTTNTTGNLGPVLDQRQRVWVGISQGDVGWRELHDGVPPTTYSNQVNGIPAYYEIREAIEVWPAPKDTSWMLRIKGYFTLGNLEVDTDITSIDWQAVYLKAVADAKVTFKQPDAQLAESQLSRYIGDLVAGSHGTARYVPGTSPLPNATRPILLDSSGQPVS